MTSLSNKGASTEETLRAYFVKSGYYTLRAVPFVYRGFDVTDVDVWLYGRPSPVSRQRIIVDIKNKKTPQAIERIFWTKGLQEALGVEQAIVATTDKRPDVAAFGHRHGIVVLDGRFLAKLTQGPNLLVGRISEEQFFELIDGYNIGKITGDWKGRVVRSKCLVLDDLNFNQVNYWLGEGKYFADQVLIVHTHRKVAARILYLLASMVAIAIDFIMKDLAFSEQEAKFETIKDGLQFGSAGYEGTKQLVDIATGLVEQYLPHVSSAGARIRRSLQADLEVLPSKILADYFSRSSTYQHLFQAALALEAAAYGSSFRSPADLPVEARSLVSVLLDFWGVDRVRFHESLNSEQALAAPAEPAPTGSLHPESAGPLFRSEPGLK